jgi:hypothetical protein
MPTNQYRDDKTISDDAELLRRVPREHLVDDDSGYLRVSSQAFQDPPNGTPMSVLLADAMRAQGRELEAALAGHPGFSLVSVTAGLARQCDQMVVRDPLPTEPAHALVVGRKTQSVRKKFAQNAKWVVPSSPPPLG